MDDFYGAVYEPPRPGLPHVAVVFTKGRALKAVSVPSVAAGEQIIATIVDAYVTASAMVAKSGGTFMTVSGLGDPEQGQ
jgi:hypothetical protein